MPGFPNHSLESTPAAARRNDTPIADAPLEALRQFTRQMVKQRGWVGDEVVQAFLAAGHSPANVLDVVLGIGLKTLPNYTHHLVGTELDPAFAGRADEDGRAYALYGIEHSVLGVLKGMILRMPRLLYGMFAKGYVPLRIRGSMTTMPADFLVDRQGVIREAYYGKDEGDHLPFERIPAFAGMTDWLRSIESDPIAALSCAVIPAKAGIQGLNVVDAGIRWHDGLVAVNRV